MARTRTRSRSHDHWYPAWVYSAREDITRANMDRYDREMEATRSRCLEINPAYHSLPWLDRQEVWTQARKDLGLSYLEIDTGRIVGRRKEATK